MRVAEVSSYAAARDARVGVVDMKLEVVTVPVTDVDRATDFYLGLGWRQDVTPPGSGVVQLTPPGSACSVQFGAHRTSAAPGSAQNLFLVVSDIQAARDELVGRGVEVSEIFHPRTARPAVPIPSIAATPRSSGSAIRTATAGCSRRSPPASPDASAPP
jgi:catechol 2,3-dioxygenase-like lactoylglutathione lyase family enzyme